MEKTEFIVMMEYGQDPAKFSLPQQEGVRWRVMKLRENTIEETKALFVVSFVAVDNFTLLNPITDFAKKN